MRLDQGPLTLGRGGPYDDRHEAIPYVSEGKACALTLLREAVRGLEEEIEFATPDIDSAVVLTPNQQPSRKVFIVHGHDEGARETVARFLERIGFEAIILHEQANQGRTVIEKVVAHGDVGFAVVLLTPDDEGCKKGEAVKPRARQNVVLELGYFVGRLGRERVCALKRGDVELPSDFGGVIYEPFDEGGGWRQALGRELQAAGFAIDWKCGHAPMNQFAPITASCAPALVAASGPRASNRFLEFFTIRNPHTRRACARAATEFFDWLAEEVTLDEVERILV